MSEGYNIDQMKAMVETITKTADMLAKSQHRGTSYLPYYKEEFALEVAKVVRAVITTGKPHLIPKRDQSFSTVKNRFYQAKKYLEDHLDPDDTFKRIFTTALDITAPSERGILIRPKKERGSLKGYAVVDWRPELADFIAESKPREKFERIGIPITAEDVAWIAEQLKGIEQFFLTEINETAIILVRMDNP